MSTSKYYQYHKAMGHTPQHIQQVSGKQKTRLLAESGLPTHMHKQIYLIQDKSKKTNAFTMPHSVGFAGALLSEGELWRVTSKMHARTNWCPHCEDKLWLSDPMCKHTSIPWWSHEQASNINNFIHIISGSRGKVLCH